MRNGLRLLMNFVLWVLAYPTPNYPKPWTIAYIPMNHRCVKFFFFNNIRWMELNINTFSSIDNFFTFKHQWRKRKNLKELEGMSNHDYFLSFFIEQPYLIDVCYNHMKILSYTTCVLLLILSTKVDIKFHGICSLEPWLIIFRDNKSSHLAWKSSNIQFSQQHSWPGRGTLSNC